MKHLILAPLFVLTLIGSCGSRPLRVAHLDHEDRSLHAVGALVEGRRSFCAGAFVKHYMVTAAHCVSHKPTNADWEVSYYRYYDRETHTFWSSRTYRVKEISEALDVAVLVPVELTHGLHASFELAERSKLGEAVRVIGHPHGEGYLVSRGVLVSQHAYSKYWRRPYQASDTTVRPGNSGGPLLNEKGELLGIVSFYRKNGIHEITASVELETLRAILGGEQ